MTRLEHRRVVLVGGPLDGCTARVYPDAGYTGSGDNRAPREPATLTLCLGAALPDWRPAGWVTYHRDPNGDYRWRGPTQTPIPGAVAAADGLTGPAEGKDTRDGASDTLERDVVGDSDITGTFSNFGFSVEDVDVAAFRRLRFGTWTAPTPEDQP